MTCRTCTTRSLSTTTLLALLAGCSGGASGPPDTQRRDVADFHEIELRGAADLAVQVGPATSLTVIADRNLLGQLKTEVSGGRLVIRIERGWIWFGGGSLKLRLTTPALDRLRVSGAGDVSISGIGGATLDLALDGAGDLRASGATGALEARIRGAGDMDLSQLNARDAKVSVNGAGNLKVRATGALDATINGAGSISYAGNPQPVTTRINGVGSITPAGPGAA